VKRGWCRDLAVMILAATTVFYAWQRLCMLPPFVPRSAQSYWQWSFVLTEAVALIYELWVCAVLRRMTDHSRAADSAAAAFGGQPVSSLPRVAVFLTTFGEPPGIVQLSLKAARALRDNYQGELTVYCLDDGLFKNGADGRPFSDAATEERSRKLRRACAKHGAVYLANPDKRRAKAGNLQFAFDHTTEEVIVVLDADFHADPHRFLPRTVGLLLQNPEVGLVQVPQCFINPDPIALNLCVPRAICDSQIAFMRVVEPCRDRFGNAFCVGSGWVVRRSALEAIGGFRNLTTYAEDLETTYRLKLAGYETRFLNETLAFGLAPESLPEFLGQQARWCLGCLQQVPLRSGPIRGRHRLLDRLFTWTRQSSG
jgi:cellulose synthase (UDP-forming)